MTCACVRNYVTIESPMQRAAEQVPWKAPKPPPPTPRPSSSVLGKLKKTKKCRGEEPPVEYKQI